MHMTSRIRIRMRAACGLVGWMIAASAAGCAGRSQVIDRRELHAEIDRHVCALWSPEVQQWGGPLIDERCPQPEVRGEAARLAARVVARVGPTMMLATAAERRFDDTSRGRPGSAQAAADGLARAAFWSDPEVTRAVALATRVELGAGGWRCEGCPEVAAPQLLTLRWSAFLPYLSAYIWPVGREQGGVDVFTCTGTNGGASVSPAPRLQRAGLLTAFHYAIDEGMGAQIHAIATTASSVDEASSRILAMLDAPAGRAHACAALVSLEWLVGVRIDECG